MSFTAIQKAFRSAGISINRKTFENHYVEYCVRYRYASRCDYYTNVHDAIASARLLLDRKIDNLETQLEIARDIKLNLGFSAL